MCLFLIIIIFSIIWPSDVASSHNEFCKVASCVVSSTGLVSCIPPCSHDAKCLSDYSRWPFDTQNCTLHIGTWVNSGEEIDFKVLKSVISENDLDSQSRQWRLIQATYRRNAGNFSETKSTYPSLTFSFTIERHSATWAALILGPALRKHLFLCFRNNMYIETLLISLMYTLLLFLLLVFILFNLISLWIDTENVQRIFLLAVSMYAHLYFLEQETWLVPNNGDVCPDVSKCNVFIFLFC